MHRFILAFAALLGATEVAQANKAVSSVPADDKNVRFTIESGSRTSRVMSSIISGGAFILKNETAPQPLGRVTPDPDSSEQSLVAQWRTASGRLYDGGKAAGGQSVNLTISAEQPNGATAFQGVYDMAAHGGEKPDAFNGKVSCGAK